MKTNMVVQMSVGVILRNSFENQFNTIWMHLQILLATRDKTDFGNFSQFFRLVFLL